MKTEDRAGYSLVLSAFQGKFKDFQEAATREFGRRGFSAFSFFWDDKNLPAEIAASLDKETARRIATGLEAAGASVAVVPSYEVTGVRWHAQVG